MVQKRPPYSLLHTLLKEIQSPNHKIMLPDCTHQKSLECIYSKMTQCTATFMESVQFVPPFF